MFKRYPLQKQWNQLDACWVQSMERNENNSYAFGEIGRIVKRSFCPTSWTIVWHFSSFVRLFKYESETTLSSFSISAPSLFRNSELLDHWLGNSFTMNRFQASSSGPKSDWDPLLQSIYGFLNPIYQKLSSVRFSVEWDWKAMVPTTDFQAGPKESVCSDDLTYYHESKDIRPVADLFMIQGLTDFGGTAEGDLEGTYGNQILERSWANESPGFREIICNHSADSIPSSQAVSSLDCSETNQDIIQTTRLSDENSTEPFSPIVVCKTFWPATKVQIQLLPILFRQLKFATSFCLGLPCRLCRKPNMRMIQ